MSKNYYPRTKNIIGSCITMLIVCLLMGSQKALAQPTISSVSAGLGIGGTTSLTITGTNFDATAANDIVFFGATKAAVSTASTTSLTVTVPVGAIYAPISVLNTTTHLTGYQKNKFLPVYDTTCFTGMTGFVNFKPSVDFTSPTAPVTVNIGDMDGDGKPDLVVGEYGSTFKVSVYRNTSTTGAVDATSFASPVTVTTTTTVINLKIADLDGDGKPEIIYVGPNTARVNIVKNNSTSGSLSFATPVYYVTAPGPYETAVADFDGDGKPDLAVVTYFHDSVSVLRNLITTPGTFTAASFASRVNFQSGAHAQSICTADIDGDGKQDMISSSPVDNTVSVFRNTTSTGAFTSSSFAAKVDFTTGTRPQEVQTGDLDGDGKPEIIVADSTANAVSVFSNTSTSGTVSMAAKVDYAVGTTPLGIALADINGDGKLDIIAGTFSSAGGVSVIRNATTSTGSLTSSSFATYTNIATDAFAYSIGVAAGDLDGDNKPDIITTNYGTNNISILKNYPLPHVDTIHGDSAVCASLTSDPYTDATTGGIWSVTNHTGSVINSTTGVLIPGATAGADTITYVVVCGGDSAMVTKPISIIASPVVGAISGSTALCVGSTITLSDTTVSGGFNTTSVHASVTGAGVVTGLSTGTATITFSETTSCGTFNAYFTVTVNPAVGVLTGPSSVCTGNSITLSDASSGTYSVAAGSPASVNAATGVVTGVSAGTAVISFTNGSGCTVTDNITVNAASAPITGLDTICVGQVTTLSDVTPGGHWYSLVSAVARIDSLTGVLTGVAAGSTIIYYAPYFGAPCSASVVIYVNSLAPPVVSITGSPATGICAGTPVTYTANTVGGGATPFFQWQINGVISTASTTNTLTYTPANGDLVSVVLFSSSPCVSPTTATASLVVSITPTTTTSISISTALGGDTVCTGGATSLHATATNGGTTPQFQWYVNGVLTGFGSSFGYVPANGDVVIGALESSIACPAMDTVRDTLVIQVVPYSTPTVTISGSSVICEGYTTELYADPTFAGTAPIYEWTVNGVNTSSSSSLMYTPATGDVVQLVLTSNYPCLTTPVAISAADTLTYVPVASPSVMISATNTIVLPGELMTDNFTAIVTDGGLNPVFQWYIDGVAQPGEINATFATTHLPHRDSVSVIVTNTDLCNGISVFDFIIVDTGHNIGVNTVNAANSTVAILPNPNTGTFTIKGDLGMGANEAISIELTNMMGQVVFTDELQSVNGAFDKRITLDSNLPSGMYLLNVHSAHMSRVIHCSLQR